MMKNTILKFVFLSLFLNITNQITAQEYQKQTHVLDGIKQSTVFNSGIDGVNSYRIPSIVTANDGTLLVFCEARKGSWRDKSPTDLVMKRSLDNGATWEPMKILLNGGIDAYMDPTPIIDKKSGRISVFTSLWPHDDHSGMADRSIMIYSDDNGATWSDALDITDKLHVEGKHPVGFGPGAGLQMQGSKFKDRLVLPVRYKTKDQKRSNHVVISDDGGNTWQVGAEIGQGEYQVGEAPLNTLTCNMRYNTTKENDGIRAISTSQDGGLTWSEISYDKGLPKAVCQACTYGSKGWLYYTGIEGGEKTKDFDNRQRLMLAKSMDGGKSWFDKQLLNTTAAGYSCMTNLKDGRMAIIFETADTPGFSRKMGERVEGWMRLDIIILPRERRYSTFYYQRSSLFETLSIDSDDIVFLGNSISNGGEWSELFNNVNVKNRGISGDVTKGVYDRLPTILKGNPKKIFVLIGINDLARGISADSVYNGILDIATLIKSTSPTTEIYIQSILPVNDCYGMFKGHTSHGDKVIAINKRLSEFAKSPNSGIKYVDLFSSFANEQGKMKMIYSNDGLHLTGTGYQHWADLVEKLVIK